MKEPEFNYEGSTLSKFHGAFKYVERMDIILKKLADVTTMRDGKPGPEFWLNRNYNCVVALMKELWGKMDEEEKKKHTGRYNELKKSIKYSNLKSLEKAFVSFDEWEFELRDLAERKGLIMPNKAEESGL